MIAQSLLWAHCLSIYPAPWAGFLICADFHTGAVSLLAVLELASFKVSTYACSRVTVIAVQMFPLVTDRLARVSRQDIELVSPESQTRLPASGPSFLSFETSFKELIFYFIKGL